ncbi:MAG: hypothetical protein M3P87_11725 [Actinomycetota bacterium]|nr:hypothetical protein [Actinomycetota bacterium]
MTEPTPRQVLYALVAGGFFIVVLALIVWTGFMGVVSISWTLTMAALWLILALWSAFNWKQTFRVLLFSIGLFLFWGVATVLIVKS